MNEIKKLVLIALVYIFIYFIFSARLIYRPSSSYFPVYYPFCIIFGTVLMLVVNIFFVHAKRKDFMIATFIALLLVYIIPFIFDLSFGSYLRKYYSLGIGRNLLGFPFFLLQEFFGK